MNTRMIYYPTIKQLLLWGAEMMDSSFNELDLIKEWDSQEKANLTYISKGNGNGKRTRRSLRKQL